MRSSWSSGRRRPPRSSLPCPGCRTSCRAAHARSARRYTLYQNARRYGADDCEADGMRAHTTSSGLLRRGRARAARRSRTCGPVGGAGEEGEEGRVATVALGLGITELCSNPRTRRGECTHGCSLRHSLRSCLRRPMAMPLIAAGREELAPAVCRGGVHSTLLGRLDVKLQCYRLQPERWRWSVLSCLNGRCSAPARVCGGRRACAGSRRNNRLYVFPCLFHSGGGGTDEYRSRL